MLRTPLPFLTKSIARILFFIAFTFINTCLYAQDKKPWVVMHEVKVIDEVTGEKLRNVDFRLYKANGERIECGVDPIINTVNGNPKFAGYALDFYGLVDTLIIEAKVDGYMLTDTTFVLSKKSAAKAVGNCYRVYEAITLKTQREPYKELKEVAVKASRILMVQKGDTIEYNAAALQLSAGSMLNNLVRALPGVQLERGGRITVNGEFVSSLLVNGKDFFKGDPNVALNNLPYYTVDKIKVYHQGAELRYFTRQDSIQSRLRWGKPLVMDVCLKKEYSGGWLANAEAAGGVRTTGEADAMYRGRVFAMHFTNLVKLGIYGTANNVGDRHKATHNGEWREMQAAGTGEPVVQHGGIDFSIENKEETMKFSTTLEAQHSTNTVEDATANQYFYDTGDIFGRSHRIGTSGSTSLDWNSTLTRKIKSGTINLMPYVKFSKGSESYRSRSATLNGDPMDAGRTSALDSIFSEAYAGPLWNKLVTSQLSMGTSESRNLSTGARIGGNMFLPLTRGKLDFSAEVNYNEGQRNGISFSRVRGRTRMYDEDLWSMRPNHRLDYSVRAMHDFLRFETKSWHLSSSLEYKYRHDTSHDEYSLRRSDEDMPECMPDIAAGAGWAVDAMNSYTTEEVSDDHGMTFYIYTYIPNRNISRKLHIKATMPVNFRMRRLDDVRGGDNRHLGRNDWLFSPRIKINNDWYSFVYEMKTHLPGMSDMLDITNSGNSLYLYKGNPNLEKHYAHTFKLGYVKKRSAISQWVNASVSGGINQNEIKTATTYDRTTGVTTYQPRNIGGNWWLAGGMNWGRALDKEKRWNISSDTRYTFEHKTEYSTDARKAEPQVRLMLLHKVGENLKVTYARNQFRVELVGKVWWYRYSDRMRDMRWNYVYQSYGVTFMSPLIWGIDLDTDLLLYMRRGYRDPSMNTTELQWNAALSTRVGKKKLWTIRAVGFDLLHQLSNITYSMNAQRREEKWNNTVRSYVSLNIIYHFEMKPKKGIR